MTRNLLAIIGIVLALCSLGMVLNQNKTTIVYVNTGKLYNDFTLTKELNKEVEALVKHKQLMLDSLMRNIKTLAKNEKLTEQSSNQLKERVYLLQQDYLDKQEAFEKETQELQGKNDGKIWNQLNEYLTVYGKQNKYSLILGAKGDGGILFGEEASDVTEGIIEYVNNRYNGKKD